jgi:TonB-linked SusC/RagA family outer membrane protein
LKDAASASIYGSRAANGVILIVTKRGTNREAMNVTYNGMIGSQLPDALPELVNGADYMMMKNENERNLGRPNLYSEAYINDYKSKVGTEPYFDTNWFGAAMKERSMEHQHTLTVRGGTEKIASMVSLSYLDQDALIEKTDFLRSGIRFNTNFQASKRLGFIMDGFVRMEETTRPSFVGGSGNGLTEMFRMMAEIPAIFPAMWSDGTIGEGWQGNNPLGYINYGGQYKAYSSRILFNLRANYEIAKWLNLEVAYSPKYLSVNSKSMKNIYTYKRIDGSTGVRPTGRNGLNNSHSRSRENFYQSLIRYQKSYGKHATSALLGFEAVDYRNDNFWASRENYTLPEYEVLDTGDGNFKDNGGSASEWALSSFFSRINYAFSEKYLVEANLRYDGSSRFARENRWGWFPSFSLGWRVKEENFLKNVNDISNLKLRFSWGQLGNQNIGNYPYLGVVSINQPYYFGKAVVQGAAQTVLPNRNVTWETTLVLNGGIDFGFFNNRLSGSLDVYKKNTFDILYTRDIPAIIGLSASEQNIAEVQNVGWDLQLSWEDNISDFRYGADLVLSDVRNKVLNLNGKPQYGRNVVFEDEEYQAFYGYECIGIYRSPEDLAKYPALNTTVKIGDLIYRDQNDDKLINPADDKKIIGSSIPRFNYGLTLSCAYKSFDFSVFLQGVGKKDLYYSRGADAAYGGNYYKHELGRLVPDDPTTYTTATWIKMGGALANNEDNSFYLYDAKYLRFKNIVLGYTLPPSILRFVGLSGLRVYATGQNLFTLDKLSIKSVDPEAPSTSSGPSYYPNTKTLALGVDIKF